MGGWSVPDILTGHQGWIISIPSDQSMVSSWNLSLYFCTVTVHMQNKVKYSVEVVISLNYGCRRGRLSENSELYILNHNQNLMFQVSRVRRFSCWIKKQINCNVIVTVIS